MKYKKPSKVTQRAIEGGAIPPACGKVKHWKPKLRNWVVHDKINSSRYNSYAFTPGLNSARKGKK